MTEKYEHCSTVLRTFVRILTVLKLCNFLAVGGGGGSLKPPGQKRDKIK